MGRAIQSEIVYNILLKAIEQLIDIHPPEDSPEGKDLDLLGMLVEQYEEIHYPMKEPTPEEMAEFRRDQECK